MLDHCKDGAADDHWRATVEGKHLLGRGPVSRKLSPRLEPLPVGRGRLRTEDRQPTERLHQSRPVRVDTIHKTGGALIVAEEDLATRAKMRNPAFHTGDLARRRSPDKRR